MVMITDKPILFYECFLCERQFQFGRYVYEGQYIPTWRINICNTCRSTNWNGIDPSQHPRLLQLLNKERLRAKLNRNGLIDIPKGGAPPKLQNQRIDDALRACRLLARSAQSLKPSRKTEEE